MILIHWLADTVTRHRFLTFFVLAATTALSICGHLYVPQPNSAGNESSEERPRVRNASRDFTGRSADCFLVVETTDVFTPQTVTALREMVAEVERLPYVESLTWVDTIPVLNVFGLRDPVLPPSDASAEMFAEVREEVSKHPLVRGQLMSEDGRTLLMPIRFDWLYVTSDADCSSELLRLARGAAARSPDVPMHIRLTGSVPLYLAYQQAFDRNHRKFQYISYTLVFVIALILFRGLRAVLVVASAPALGIIWTLGLLNWLEELSNPLTSVVLPVLLTMVGLTDGVHLMVHIRRARADGATPQEAARSAIRHVGLACALTSLTTAIGFASLLVAHSEFVRGFGRGCAIGVVVTFFAVVTSIPFLCSTWIGNNIHTGHEHDLVGHGLRRFGGVIDVVLRRAKLVSLLAIVSTFGLGLIAAQLRPDDKTKDSQPTGSEAYQALTHCDEALGGIESVRVVVSWPEEVPGDSEQILTAISDVERILNDEDSMQHPLSILNILASFPGDESVTARLPFLELLPASVKGSYFNTDSRSALMTVRIQDLGIARYEPVFQRVEVRLLELESKYPSFQIELGGEPVRRGRNLYRIVVDLAASLGTASVVILIVMAIVYRSLRIGMITVIPNLFPLVVTASMMVLLNHPLEIASVCAFTVCLGIAVDDTIHFLTRYRDERSAGKDSGEALRAAFHGVGSAMIITTFILVSGFGTVLSSELPGQRYFAAMAVSTIAAALVGDLVFLPALLARFDRSDEASSGARL
ncbi:MAG: RND transporter [Planctomycetaceae bacterium]|nr:RND transporter [Planctomycetaceae bacterium]